MFKLRKTRQKLALSLTPLGAVCAAAQGTGYDVWENPMVYASTRDWSSLYGTMRFESETASLPHVPARTSSVSGNTPAVSLFYTVRSGCSEFCLSSL